MNAFICSMFTIWTTLCLSSISFFFMFHFSLSFKIYVSLLFYLNQTRTYTFIDVRIDVLMWFSVLNFTKDNYFTYYSIYIITSAFIYMFIIVFAFVIWCFFLLFILQCEWPVSNSYLMLVIHKLYHFGGFQTIQIKKKIFTKVMKKFRKKEEKISV